MAFETLLISDVGPVRTITLNRPERRNAMTPGMQDDLIRAFGEAAQDTAVRVLVLAGAGQSFCAGLDLGSLRATLDGSETESASDARRIADLFRTLYELPKPTIAVVHGAAIAGGTGLATICDFTLAAPETKFGYTEVRIGFVPAIVSAYLALQVGDKRSRSLLLSGRLFAAEEALGLGLVSEICPAEQLTSRARELAEELLRNSSEAMAATKRLLAAQNREWLDGAVRWAIEANAQARSTADFREGISAFLEKRPPVWE